jgi:hypothetical protein
MLSQPTRTIVASRLGPSTGPRLETVSAPPSAPPRHPGPADLKPSRAGPGQSEGAKKSLQSNSAHTVGISELAPEFKAISAAIRTTSLFYNSNRDMYVRYKELGCYLRFYPELLRIYSILSGRTDSRTLLNNCMSGYISVSSVQDVKPNVRSSFLCIGCRSSSPQDPRGIDRLLQNS